MSYVVRTRSGNPTTALQPSADEAWGAFFTAYGARDSVGRRQDAEAVGFWLDTSAIPATGQPIPEPTDHV